QSAGGFPYFRPLGATVWRLSYLLWDANNPLWLHALNLAFHALNGWLVGWLARRLWTEGTRTRRASLVVPGLAATFFVLFPFSYQAVPWVGALYHLLATTLVLTAVVSHLQWQHTRQRRWLIAGLLAVLLAPFAHENGLIAAPLVLTYQLLRPPLQPDRLIQRTTMSLLWFAPLLLWLPLWWLAPKGHGNLAVNNLETTGQNAAYFAQGLAFPFVWPGGWLRDTWGWNDLLTAVLLIGLAGLLVAATAVLVRRQKWSVLLLLGLPMAWGALGALPAVLLLKAAYVISAPRLLMLASVGAALLWAFVAGAWLTWAQEQLAGLPQVVVYGAVGLLVTAVVLPAGWFITDHMNQHERLGRVWWQLAQEVGTSERENTAVVLNFPGGLANPTTFYPLGHEGTVFNVSYIPPARIYDVNAPQHAPRTIHFRRYDDIKPQLPYLYGVLDDGQDWPSLVAEKVDTAVFNTRYTTDDIWLEPVGGWTATPPTKPPLTVFPDLNLALVAGQSTAVSPHTIAVRLDWFAPEPLGYEWTTFVHVLDKTTGELVAQGDGHALANTYPMGQWSVPLAVWEQRFIELPPGVAPEQVVTAVGLYNWQTGERLAVQEGDTAVGLPITH
ncbi:MAG: hypothetical protein KDD89_02750, partial [Anaerolineales bacterium]|nr:hypothetical protein [Anaerolineales bacterium]